MTEQETMHRQHRQENADHAQWLRDISRWRVDHRNAFAILSRVEATIHEFDAEMEAHAAAIRDHHLHIMHHERELKSAAADEHPQVHELYRKAHAEQAAMHADVGAHHAQLAERHQEMMNNLAALFEELSND